MAEFVAEDPKRPQPFPGPLSEIESASGVHRARKYSAHLDERRFAASDADGDVSITQDTDELPVLLRDPLLLSRDSDLEETIRSKAALPASSLSLWQKFVRLRLPATTCTEAVTVESLLKKTLDACESAQDLWREPANDPAQLWHAVKATSFACFHGIYFLMSIACHGIIVGYSGLAKVFTRADAGAE